MADVKPVPLDMSNSTDSFIKSSQTCLVGDQSGLEKGVDNYMSCLENEEKESDENKNFKRDAPNKRRKPSVSFEEVDKIRCQQTEKDSSSTRIIRNSPMKNFDYYKRRASSPDSGVYNKEKRTNILSLNADPSLVRSNSSLPGDIPNFGDSPISEGSSSFPFWDDENLSVKKKSKGLRFLKTFFLDGWITKIVCCIPIGILASSVLRRTYGVSVYLALYVLLFSVFVSYPSICLLHAIYKLLLPHFQLWRYSPRSDQDLGPPPIREEEQDTVIDLDGPNVKEELSVCIDKRLLQIKLEGRRPSARRCSTLPSISEKESDERNREKEEEEEEEEEKENDKGEEKKEDKNHEQGNKDQSRSKN